MELSKVTIVYRDKDWVAREAECKCGKYMDAEPVDGIPTLIRSEDSLASTQNRKRIEGDIKNNKEYL